MKNWDDFDKFTATIDKYMPREGQGETMASQICTAVNKLIYKWYNDGDVYDNQFNTLGWMNDLSSYANWLYMVSDHAKIILHRVFDISTDSEYEDILYDLAEYLLDDDFLEKYETIPAFGSIYSCEGVFKFIEEEDEEEY